jgi:hypothetical protein
MNKLGISLLPLEIHAIRFWFIFDSLGLYTGWRGSWQATWNSEDGFIFDWTKSAPEVA